MSWIVLALLSALFAAMVAVFGKIGVKGVDSTLATTVRAVVMALFLLAVALASGKFNNTAGFGGRTLIFIILSGVAGALSWLCYFLALKYGPAGGVAALDRLSVVFVIVLATMFLGEGLTIKLALGALLLTAGAVLIVWK